MICWRRKSQSLCDKHEPLLDIDGKPPLADTPEENARTAFQLACDKTARLDAAFQTLEAKAGSLAGFLATVLAVVLSDVLFRKGQPSGWTLGTLVVFCAGTILLVLALLLLVLCLVTRPWQDAPGWEQFDDDHEYQRDPGRYRCQRITDMKGSWTKNKSALRHKSRLFNHAAWFMVAGILLLACATLASVVRF